MFEFKAFFLYNNYMIKKMINCRSYLWGVNLFVLLGISYIVVPTVLYFYINLHHGWLIISIFVGIYTLISNLIRMFYDLFICKFYEDRVEYYWFGKLKKTLYYKDIYYAIEPGPFHNSKYLYLYYKDNQKIPQRYKFDNSKRNRLFFEKIGISKKYIV